MKVPTEQLLVAVFIGFAVVTSGNIYASAAARATTTPVTQASSEPTAAQIVAGMAAARRGLDSYSAPIHFNLTVHKVISVSTQLDAVRYFEVPDKEVLVMNSMPSIAKQFRYIYSGLGTPLTWPLQYDITLQQDQSVNGSYVLKGVPKNNPGISYVLLTVESTTLAPTQAQWFYANGGTVSIQYENSSASGYLLPSLETIDIAFPDYKVHATGHYGQYVVNQPIPESVWLASPQPLPT